MSFKNAAKLLLKDLFIYKKVFLINCLGVVISNCLFAYVTYILKAIKYDYFSFFSSALMLTCITFGMYINEESRNKAAEFLLTASYTRKSLVISRYFLCIFLLFVQLFFSVLGISFMNNRIFFDFNWYVVFTFSCIIFSVLIPPSFMFERETFIYISSLVGFSVMMLNAVAYKKGIDKLLFSRANNLHFIIFTLISIVLLFVSNLISQKKFRKKDL